MADCFDNFIGIRLACPPSGWVSPRSGLYINDLPGFNLKAVSEVSYDGDALRMLNDRIAHAMRWVADNIAHNISDLRFNTAVDMFIGIFGDATYTPAPVEICAMDFRLYWRQMQVFSKFRVNSIRLMALADTSAVVWITDGAKSYTVSPDGSTHEVTGFDVDGIPDNTVDGVPVSVDVIANTETVLVADFVSSHYELALNWAPGVEVRTVDNSLANCCGAPPRGGGNFFSTGGRGITGDVSVFCDPTRFACNVLHEVKYAVLYKVAIEVLEEWIASDRMSWFSMYSTDWAKSQLENYTKKLEDELRTRTPSIRRLALKLDRWCFECNRNIRVDQIT